MRVCWMVRRVCGERKALRSRLTFPVTALNFSQCQELSGREKERQRQRKGEEDDEKGVAGGTAGPRTLSARLRVEGERVGLCVFLPVLLSSPGDVR